MSTVTIHVSDVVPLSDHVGPVDPVPVLFGVDTRKRDATASAAVLEALTPFFEDGVFQAPVIDRAIPLSEGCSAYVQVARGEARGRLILTP